MQVQMKGQAMNCVAISQFVRRESYPVGLKKEPDSPSRVTLRATKRPEREGHKYDDVCKLAAPLKTSEQRQGTVCLYCGDNRPSKLQLSKNRIRPL